MFVVLPLSFDVWVKKNISGDQSHEGLNVTGQGRRFEWLNRGSNRLTQKPGTAIPLFETSIFYEHLRNISETSQNFWLSCGSNWINSILCVHLWWNFLKRIMSRVHTTVASVADVPGECWWLGKGLGSDAQGTSSGAGDAI